MNFIYKEVYKQMGQNFSSHQQKIIKNYYQNLSAIAVQKLQELVTDLYLSLNTPKEDKLWNNVEKAMEKLEIPKSVIDHIMQKRNVEVLANHVTKWMGK